VLPTTFGANVSILSHTGIYDGLYFDGNFINFKINFSTLGSVVASWPVPDFLEAYHVVGVYSPQKIQLYINRVLVSETEITSAQLADGFAQEPSSLLCSGQSVSGNERLIVDGIAIFSRTLSKVEIASHFLAGRDVTTADQNVSVNGGAYFDGTKRDTLLQTIFANRDDWATGLSLNVSGTSGILIPSYDQTTLLSQAGVWKGSMPISITGSTSGDIYTDIYTDIYSDIYTDIYTDIYSDSLVYGIRASWDGDGSFTVAASLDDTTYTTLTNGQLIPGTTGLDSTGLVLDIRITFTGGLASDPACVRDISLTAYASNTVYGSDQSRNIVLTGAVSTALESNEPLERNTGAGFTFSGGYATLTADLTTGPADPDATYNVRDVAAVEMWINPASLSANAELYDARPTYGYIMYNSGGNLTYTGHSAVYINGVLAASNTIAPTIGEWMHILYIPTAPYNIATIIGQKYTFVEPFLGQIGMIGVYDTAPTSDQALALYDSYMQNPTARAVDSVGFAIAELSNAYTNHSFDWQAISASV
jgi:hypothetical protein